MSVVTWDQFANAAGSIYEVAVGGTQVELALDLAEEIESAGREGGSFRLEFLGPSDPVLAQAIYPFRRGDEVVEIFIVPFQRDGAGTRYEAIFY